jgi:hypothetical protein
MKKFWAYWVYYRSHDPQGGYWEVDPEGSFTTLGAARWAKYKLEHPVSPFDWRRQTKLSNAVRDVHIRLRLEIRLPQYVQKMNTHEKEKHHAM